MDARRRGAGIAVLVGFLVPGLVAVNAETGGSELAADTLASITGLTPQDFGAATVDGLEYADPTEALGIIEAPVPNSDGSVELAFPLGIPPGHGITPELTVQYGSGGGNGWMGDGWDLGVGEITVDTTFGAPHFDSDFESESYLLDGALLTPNANDDAWEARDVGTRNDFTRQVETEYDEIIRHQPDGDVWPADYFWEVRGTDGSVRWYGGTPDSGGPVPTGAAPTIDERAVIRNEAGHIVTWLLSAERDIGVNLIRYEYETVKYEFDGVKWIVNASCLAADELCGQHTYLDRILYTDATSSIADRNGPPYEIDFLRESEPASGSPSTAVRKDPIIDAGLGYVDVVVDRLARVEVKHGAPPASGAIRTYSGPGNIAARYDFRYVEGRFGKTLLSKVIQGVDDPYEHVIEYYDDLAGTPTVIDGFDQTPDSWATKEEIAAEVYLSRDADISLLGGSETNGGSGNIYIGFNPASPSKTFSFGQGVELSGSDTESIAEWIDLNGDNLPDKVFINDAGNLQFRLNDSGPGGAAAWDVTGSDNSIHDLSKNSNFAFQISGEAYPVVALGIGTGLAFSWTNNYFSDVNGDGLVDFVSNGQVYFNTLNASNIPTFSTSSAGTDIPLAPSALPDMSSAELADLSAKLALQSPPIDTVRRWVAPFDGTVSILAPATLTGTSPDGVRVAIQHNGTELVTAHLTTGAPGAFAASTPPLQNVPVLAGESIYFRVGAGADGTNDLVSWSPQVTYAAAWSADANGLSQAVYSAAADFTLAGRPNDFIAMPATGTALVQASVALTAPLTDAVTVVLVKRDLSGDHATAIGTIPANTPVGAPLDVDANVAVALTEWDDPATPGSDLTTVADKLSVYLSTDSPVDLGAINFSATITYTETNLAGDPVAGPIGANGDPIPLVDGLGDPSFAHNVRPHIEIYPHANRTTPPGNATISGNNDVVLAVTALTDVPGGITTVDAFITVKTVDDGLLHKVKATLNVSGNTATTSSPIDLDIPVGTGTRFVDVSIRDNVFSRGGLALTKFSTTDGVIETPIENATLRWSGMQGIFPQPYRGWGIAGYTAGEGLGASALLESAFVIDTSSYSTTVPTRDEVSLDEAHAEPSYAFVSAVGMLDGTTAEPVATDRWVGPRANLFGDAAAVSTSLLAVDSVDFSRVTMPNGAGGRSAPTRLGITGPGLTLSFGIGLLGASAGLSPSFGLTDFSDLNGDGYPDVVAAGNVTYTNQLGAYLPTRGVGRTSVTNQDLTISINGGLSAGMVDIASNPGGSTNSVSGDAASKGSSASDSGPSYSLGIAGSGGYSWSSPNASGGSGDPGAGTYSEQVDTLQSDFAAAPGAEIQRAFADVNGDGLPDSVYTTGQGTYAFYNLGYGFTRRAVKLGSGGFESRESAVGGAGIGFALPYGEFGGGVNFLWNYDWSTYSWNDINGDGILDQLRRYSGDDIKIRFGTGSGLLPEVSYGAFSEVTIAGSEGQHISFDQSTGIGGGVSATGYIGPLCLVACYLVIGGGAGYNNSRSTSTADVEDVNGDGYADALFSLNDNELKVKLNQQARTNFLKTVTNPLGGSFTVDYERAGNTADHPDSVWVMSRLDISDGRSTNGSTPEGTTTTGHYANTIQYAGLDYDRTHRASLGFDTVTVTELDTVAAGEPAVRINEQVFLNENIFVKGLLTEATMYEPDPAGRIAVRGSTVTWGFRDVRPSDLDQFDSQVPVVPISAGALALTPTDTVGSRGRSITPLIGALDEYWYDGDDRTFSKTTEYTHDGLGNVIEELDLGAPDDDFDDLRTEIDYSDCASDTVNGCLPVSTPRQPFWSAGMCVNWASYPTRVSVFGVDTTGTEVLLRERVSPVQMCDNGAATVLQELVSNTGGSKVYATSDLTLNQYGDYALVMAPAGSDGVRYTVRYGYDSDRHSDISSVEEFDVTEANASAVLTSGPTAANSTAGISSSATFDPLSGRVASKTDGNGARRDYAYDEHGRIVETSTMAATPSAATTPLITYEYHGNAAGYGYAVSRHVDSFDGNSPAGGADSLGGDTTATIDTTTFVDGLGRVRQTKRDARLSVAGAPPVNTRQVTDGVEFDVLARPVILYGPTADSGAAASFSPEGVDGAQTVTEWFSYDLPYTITEPGDRTTGYDYPWVENGAGVLLAWTVATDPEGRVTTIGQDVRDVQRLHIDEAAPRTDAAGVGIVEDPLLTEYLVNSLGELGAVVDSTGAVTEYDYDLTGQTTRAFTPNGGTVAYSYDLAGNQRVMINDAMAAINVETTYDYRFNRLTNIDHPGTVDDITYEYGLDNADGLFTAGRIRHIEDRARLVDNSYDKNGAMIEQTAIIKRHNWRPTMTPAEMSKFAYTTRWSYDALGRIETVGYPDAKTVSFLPAGASVATLTSAAELAPLLATVDLEGEVATYDYDSGGLLREVTGAEEGIVFVGEQIAPDLNGNVATIQVPRRVTHEYSYLDDRVYEPRLLAVRDEMGNGTISDYSFDLDTRWLESKKTTSANPDPAIATRIEVQDLEYTYDVVGRPKTYDNNLPLANRAINGGDVHQEFDYDGFGRLRGASGTFDIKDGEQQRFAYGVEFTADAPWSVIKKNQQDALFTTRGKPSTKVNAARTYSFDRVLQGLAGTGGPLQAVSDKLTVGGKTTTYGYQYNKNGAINSMLAEKPVVAPTTTTIPKGKPKPAPTPAPSETNVWDRRFTWTLTNQLTSASDGSELRTFAYDDTGALMIQDGNLLSRDGVVIAESGGGPETIFLNAWVTVRSQKIYKHVRDGLDTIATKMDSGAGYEAKQMFIHTDVIGSTNAVTDNQGRGFQRHEYFPSGEIWINDHKEEIRTPFQFADGYYEDEFDLVLFGARWYDVERELFLSPDPLLSSDVQALIGQPSLGGAYTYAGANAVGNVDPSGLRFFGAHQRVDVKAKAQESFEIDQFVLKITGEGSEAQTKLNKRIKLLEGQARAEAVLEPNAIIKIDLDAGTVSVGAPYGPRKEWQRSGGNSGSKAAPKDDQTLDPSSSSDDDSIDATNGSGGPDAGGSGASPGSATIGVGDDAGEGGSSDASSDQPSPQPKQQGAAGGGDIRLDD